jgi:hypothetical protein
MEGTAEEWRCCTGKNLKSNFEHGSRVRARDETWSHQKTAAMAARHARIPPLLVFSQAFYQSKFQLWKQLTNSAILVFC